MNRSLGWTLFFSLVASVAAASPVYPGTIKRELGLANPPLCTTCHQSLAGGTGTAVKPFALAARERGLTGLANITKLQEVLAQMEKEKLDTDGDGVPNIAELKAGTNPNPEEAPPAPPAAPAQTGTSAESKGDSGAATTAWIIAGIEGLALLVAAALLLKRDRSR